MVKRIFWAILVFVCAGLPVWGTQGGFADLSGCVAIPAGSAGVNQLYGEILEISPAEMLLHTIRGDARLRMNDKTRFWRNEQPASWRALRPVYENAFCEAYVGLNRQNDVTSVKGFYRGTECLIQDWRQRRDGLWLQLLTVEGEKRLECPLASDARLPNFNWLEKEETVFVLFNLKGGVRGIYLIH